MLAVFKGMIGGKYKILTEFYNEIELSLTELKNHIYNGNLDMLNLKIDSDGNIKIISDIVIDKTVMDYIRFRILGSGLQLERLLFKSNIDYNKLNSRLKILGKNTVSPINTIYETDNYFKPAYITFGVYSDNGSVCIIHDSSIKLPISCRGLFERFNLKSVDLSNTESQDLTNLESMFEYCSNLEDLNIRNFNTRKVVNMAYMFEGCGSLEYLDLHNFTTESLVTASSMFKYCTNLKYLDLSSFDITHVKNISNMFYGCRSLENIKLHNSFKALDIHGLFSYSPLLDKHNITYI